MECQFCQCADEHRSPAHLHDEFGRLRLPRPGLPRDDDALGAAVLRQAAVAGGANGEDVSGGGEGLSLIYLKDHKDYVPVDLQELSVYAERS